MGRVLRLCIAKWLLVLPPGEGDRGRAAARCLTGEAHVAAQDDHCVFRLRDDLRLGEVV